MELTKEQLAIESINTLGTLSQQFCPECGAPMSEVDRVNEKGGIYIWYECSKSNCNGSWLEKIEKP